MTMSLPTPQPLHSSPTGARQTVFPLFTCMCSMAQEAFHPQRTLFGGIPESPWNTTSVPNVAFMLALSLCRFEKSGLGVKGNLCRHEMAICKHICWRKKWFKLCVHIARGIVGCFYHVGWGGGGDVIIT